jgi:TPR repeat protein
VAVCYEVGAGTKKDNAHAIQFFRKAANLGDGRAMYKLSMILLRGTLGQAKNPREGMSWLERAVAIADDSTPQPIHDLGVAFEKEGIPSVIPDLNYARDLFTRAAQYGYAPSQFKLGLAYENGFLHCPIDPRRSIAW